MKHRPDGVLPQPVASGLHFPTSLAVDDEGCAYVAESGLPFGGGPAGGRVLRVHPDGAHEVIAEGLQQPVNGLTFHDGSLWVSEGGHPARISRLELDGTTTPVLEDLPGPGNYHTNMVAFGPDGKLYFSQGAMTNLGIIGLDAYELGWLRRLPHGHDVPGYDVELTGVNVTTPNPLDDLPGEMATTGAFAQFGTPTVSGQRVPAGLPATAAVMRCEPDGSGLELVAWGLRNAWAIGFDPDGRLLAIDQGADDRGSRPIGNAPDLLFEVRQGAWYGWPDFIGGVPVSDERFVPARGPAPTPLLANHDELPPPEPALFAFPPHVSAVKFDVVPDGPHAGQLLVALFGDEAPMCLPAGGPKLGRALVRVDRDAGRMQDVPVGPLLRPIDVRIVGDDVYVLDFGHFEMLEGGLEATAGTGALCRIPLAAL